MTKVASDENLHFLFYRDLVEAALEEDPSEVVMAIDRQVCGFEMPGAEIDGFTRHAAATRRSAKSVQAALTFAANPAILAGM